MLHGGMVVTVNHGNTQHVSISLEERLTLPLCYPPSAQSWKQSTRTELSFSVFALTSFRGDDFILMRTAVEETSAPLCPSVMAPFTHL